MQTHKENLSNEKHLIGEYEYYSKLLATKSERQKILVNACNLHGALYMLYTLSSMQIAWEKIDEYFFNIITEDIHYIEENFTNKTLKQ